MKVAFNNLNAQWALIKNQCKNELDNLFERSDFILGSAVNEFETLFAEYVGCKYAVGVSNGTDALKLSSQALGVNGSTLVIIPANTFIATILGVEQAYPAADFKLIDCDEYHQMDVSSLKSCLEKNRSKYNNCIIVPVHLYGYTCDMTSIMAMSKYYNCYVLEDSSQAHGAKWADKLVGSFGNVSAFSLYPGKNLGAAGDAGIITTNDNFIYEKLLSLRNLGSTEKYKHEIKGSNHRLDTLQAIILKHKMPLIEKWNETRRHIIKLYEAGIDNNLIKLPQTHSKCFPVHHIYPVLVSNREKFTEFLNDVNIQWGLHYPICIEEMPMYTDLANSNYNSMEFSKNMVSLPIHPFLKDDEIEYVIDQLNNYT